MKLIMLDRDGVINYESYAYIKSPAEWIPIPGSLQAIASLKQAGYTVAVATNQSGIARGYYDHDTLADIHHKMQTLLAEFGASIDKIVYCPHHPDEHCQCRKPQPGMLHAIAAYFNCDLTDVPFVGDRQTDIEVAQCVGAKPIFLTHGRDEQIDINIEAHSNLADWVSYFLRQGD